MGGKAASAAGPQEGGLRRSGSERAPRRRRGVDQAHRSAGCHAEGAPPRCLLIWGFSQQRCRVPGLGFPAPKPAPSISSAPVMLPQQALLAPTLHGTRHGAGLETVADGDGGTASSPGVH